MIKEAEEQTRRLMRCPGLRRSHCGPLCVQTSKASGGCPSLHALTPYGQSGQKLHRIAYVGPNDMLAKYKCQDKQECAKVHMRLTPITTV